MFNSIRLLAQEARELGLTGSAFRIKWELREALTALSPDPRPSQQTPLKLRSCRVVPLPESVSAVAGSLLSADEQRLLLQKARAAMTGRITAFGDSTVDYGDPIKWHNDPLTDYSYPKSYVTGRQIRTMPRNVDIKFAWELARFPQAYEFGRAAVYAPAARREFAAAFTRQLQSFAHENPPYGGIHWSSGQEIALRCVAWWFGVECLLDREAFQATENLIANHLAASAEHIERKLAYAQHAVFNNHLLSEALGLLAIGSILESQHSHRWENRGQQLISEQVHQQFYEDGSYIQQSHTYQRLALILLLWACAFLRARKRSIPEHWSVAMSRSLDFLYQQQDPTTGWLPNYGANDGAQPCPLSSSRYEDFRPVLQAVSCVAHRERLYDPGPWDEMAVWLVGPSALDLPLSKRRRHSKSFDVSGYHTLRSIDESTFGVLRCGTLRNRFSQIDMLHFDLWWRGNNILCDPGSYRYNGAPEWHRHFMSTRAHNTIEVDRHNQMVHHRQFKVLYWTRAKVLLHVDRHAYAMMVGEHYAYVRTSKCTHRRSVLFGKPDIWVICDEISGPGEHAARLQWQVDALPHTWSPEKCQLSVESPSGVLCIQVLDSSAAPLIGSVVSGQDAPPQGWISRRYGRKKPAPSLSVDFDFSESSRVLTVVAPGTPQVSRVGEEWTVITDVGGLKFVLNDTELCPFGNVHTDEGA